ncbi:MAG: hypothetical protein JNL96_05630 [Planctomycetaceae bacterium]|nr:hypothetical protein [Planctomycetaceae bacterium]
MNDIFRKLSRWLRSRSIAGEFHRKPCEVLGPEGLEPRTLLAADSYAFDFGTNTSPLEAGFVRISESTRYSTTSGFGWTSGSLASADRGVNSALLRDFVFTPDATFEALVNSGRYQVSMTLGDLGGYRHDNVGVFLEGVQFDSVTTAAGQVVQRTFAVDIVDGAFTLRLRDLGGSDRNAVIESLQLQRVPSQPTLSVADAQVAEGNSGDRQLAFRISLSEPGNADVVVNFRTYDTTAGSPSDYDTKIDSLVIAAGQTEAWIYVDVHGDSTVETDETIRLSLTSVANATVANPSAIGTILNDDSGPTLTLRLSTAAVNENQGGTAAVGTITRGGAVDAPLVVNLSSNAGGTLSLPSTVEFAAGQEAATFDIGVVNNADADGRRQYTITAAADGYAPRSALLDVLDDEPPPFAAAFDFGTASSPVAPGYQQITDRTAYNGAYGWTAGSRLAADRGTSSALTRDFVYSPDATFQVAAPNGRYEVAVILGDIGGYAHDSVGVFVEDAQFDVVTTAAGQVVQRTYLVDVVDGALTLRLRDLGGSDRNAVIEALRVTRIGAVVPSVRVVDAQAAEGDDGSKQLAFQVLLSGTSQDDVTINYRTLDSTAGSPSDYAAVVSSLLIPAGQSQGWIYVTSYGDSATEADETLTLQITAVSGATIADGTAVGTIVNDDVPPSLSLSLSTSTVNEDRAGTAAIGTVSRSGSTAAPLTVSIGISLGGAITVPATVEIEAGASSANFEITTIDNTVADGRRNVTLYAAADGFAGSATTLGVIDDDVPPFAAFFDFGTTTSPLTAGYQRVSDRTTYGTQPFGWIGGAVAAADRGGDSALTRDFVYTRDATFRIDLPNGDYVVDLILGDVGGYAHDNVGVYLEDAHYDTVTTRGGQVVARSFVVNVVDGALTLRLRDLGGSDANGVIEAMRIYAAGQTPPTSAFWPTVAGIPNALFGQPQTDSDGFLKFSINTPYQRATTNVRILLPANFDPAKQYRVVYVLPVTPNLDRTYGDGLITARNNNLQNVYDAIFVAPSFSDMPWFADNANDSSIWQESYFVDVVVPFVDSLFNHLPGAEGRYLLGFSKSGYGALALLLRNSGVFNKAVAWDSEITMSDPSGSYGYMGILGTRANFDANYRITNLIYQHQAEFINGPPRAIIYGNSGSQYYNYSPAGDAAFTQAQIPHLFLVSAPKSHHWDGGWIAGAAYALLS